MHKKRLYIGIVIFALMFTVAYVIRITASAPLEPVNETLQQPNPALQGRIARLAPVDQIRLMPNRQPTAVPNWLASAYNVRQYQQPKPDGTFTWIPVAPADGDYEKMYRETPLGAPVPYAPWTLKQLDTSTPVEQASHTPVGFVPRPSQLPASPAPLVTRAGRAPREAVAPPTTPNVRVELPPSASPAAPQTSLRERTFQLDPTKHTLTVDLVYFKPGPHSIIRLIQTGERRVVLRVLRTGQADQARLRKEWNSEDVEYLNAERYVPLPPDKQALFDAAWKATQARYSPSAHPSTHFPIQTTKPFVASTLLEANLVAQALGVRVPVVAQTGHLYYAYGKPSPFERYNLYDRLVTRALKQHYHL